MHLLLNKTREMSKWHWIVACKAFIGTWFSVMKGESWINFRGRRISSKRQGSFLKRWMNPHCCRYMWPCVCRIYSRRLSARHSLRASTEISSFHPLESLSQWIAELRFPESLQRSRTLEMTLTLNWIQFNLDMPITLDYISSGVTRRLLPLSNFGIVLFKKKIGKFRRFRKFPGRSN